MLSYTAEWVRKLVHLSSFIIVGAIQQFGRSLMLKWLVALFVMMLIADITRYYSPWVQQWVARIFGKMMRTQEIESDQLVLNGATWVVFSACLTFGLFPQTIALVAFSILILGETCAALIGRKWGKTVIFKTGKSMEGTLAFIFCCLLLYIPFPEIGFARLIVGCCAGAVVELIPIPPNDNLWIPLAAAIAMMLI